MMILENYLKALKLPTFVKRYQEVAEACQKKRNDYAQFLLQLSEMEVLGRQNAAFNRRSRKRDSPLLKTWMDLISQSCRA